MSQNYVAPPPRSAILETRRIETGCGRKVSRLGGVRTRSTMEELG